MRGTERETDRQRQRDKNRHIYRETEKELQRETEKQQRGSFETTYLSVHSNRPKLAPASCGGRWWENQGLPSAERLPGKEGKSPLSKLLNGTLRTH